MQHGEGETNQASGSASLSMTMERGSPASAGRGEVPREAAANVLTNPAVDPWGKIPEFKFCGVKVERYVEAGAATAPHPPAPSPCSMERGRSTKDTASRPSP
jgi:hypothetical protein